ncbi:MAG TPA: hypothetical protein VE619_04575, partial [Nitrososphaeraceae archaeon]|nr:hypothetical protein [Nitrososphaeraceae archaeon]
IEEQQKISKGLFDKIEKMSHLSLAVFNDSVEAFLRRDYVMADSVADRVENIRSVEKRYNSFINEKDKIIHVSVLALTSG